MGKYPYNPGSIAVTEDIRNWEKRGVQDYIWSAVYQMVRGFRSQPPLPGVEPDAMIGQRDYYASGGLSAIS